MEDERTGRNRAARWEKPNQQERAEGEQAEKPEENVLDKMMEKDLEELQKLELVSKLVVREDQARQDLARTEEAILQAHKFRFEAYKTQATLGSAASVAFAAVTTGLIDDPVALSYLLWAYICTVGSVLVSMVSMSYGISIQHLKATAYPREGPSLGNKVVMALVGICDFGSLILFVAGLVFFLYFVNENLY